MKSCAILFLLILSATIAQADWGPDPSYCDAWMEYSGTETVSLFVNPDGSGRGLDNAMVVWNGNVDATVYCQLIGYSGNPIENFPAEDMWLEPGDGGLVTCALGACADTPTDVNGIATWVTPLHGGGHSQGLCYVMVNGAALFQGLNLQFNSADINGDLVVNLTDVSLFAENFFTSYHYRSDFYYDGVINLSDVGMLASSLAASCP